MPVGKILKLISLVVFAFAAIAWLLSTQGDVTTSELQSKLKDLLVIFIPAAAIIGLIAVCSKRRAE